MDILEDIQEQEREQAQTQQEKEYLLPDGFGMSLDEVRALILNKYDIKVDKDDPILLIVPILNAFLFEQQKMQEEHSAVMEKVYQQVLEEFLKALDVKLEKGDFQINVEAKKDHNKYLVLVLYCLVVILAITLTIVFLWKF